MVDRAGLADFLRRRRDMLRPSDVGLPEGTRRRIRGLRREEVALLAGMSSDYYSRLEQCRGANPSASIIAALARALRCDLDERDHLYHLAGLTPPARLAGRHIRPGLVNFVERLTDVPVMISTDLDELLWQNALSTALLGSLDQCEGRDRNLHWRWFTRPEARRAFPEEDWPRHSADHVSDLRATHARRAGDADVTRLVGDLLQASTEFRALWDRHEVSARRVARKAIQHPEVGLVDLNCEVLLTPDADQRVVAFFPVEGTDARERLDLLRVIGTQTFETSGS